MITIPTTEQLALATERHFPHYAEQFPIWKEAENGLKDNVDKDPGYDPENHPLNCTITLKSRIDELKAKFPARLAKVEANRPNETAPNSDTNDPVHHVPHPDSDTRHVDPDQGGGNFRAELARARHDLHMLQDQGRGDAELADKLTRALAPLDDADLLLGPAAGGGNGPRGMQRLKLIFQWGLCQVITIFGEINVALDTKNQPKYEEAREKYIELLRDLDDAEPETKGKVAPGTSGYGRSIKWAYIIPLIHGGRIKGAKVVAKWNPHISSSGIPIPHA
jgi:hypothetical protein